MRSLLLLGLVGAAAAAPKPGAITGNADIDSYIRSAHVTDVQWEVPTADEGVIQTINGTIQDVIKQLGPISPDAFAREIEAAADGLAKRDEEWDLAKIFCGGLWQQYGKPSHRGLNDGYWYLMKHGGQPRLDPGPGACGRVSCSWSTSIWLCSDVSKPPPPRRLSASRAAADVV